MKICFSLIFSLIFTISYSIENSDSSQTKLKANINVSINSNGIASIPAFSLDKPAILAAITLAKNRFSYDPLLSYGLDFRPWFIDNWFHYIIVDKPAFMFRTGMNLSTFFSDYKSIDETILQGQRYFAIELNGVYKISPGASLSLVYWSDNGRDKGTLKGHFVNLIGERSGISVGEYVLLSTRLQLFYLNYNGKNDGLFVTPEISSSIRKVPFNLFFQATQPIATNISPSPGFKWNIGLSFTH